MRNVSFREVHRTLVKKFPAKHPHYEGYLEEDMYLCLHFILKVMNIKYDKFKMWPTVIKNWEKITNFLNNW